MATTETPPVAALNAADNYLAVLLDEDVSVLEASAASFAAGVAAGDCDKDRRLGLQRVDARRALDLADEVAPRAAELRAQERRLVEAEQATIAEVTAELEEEFRRRLAEATEAAQAPLAEFKAEHAAEQAKLNRISKAGSDGRDLLVRTADGAIDKAIEKLQRADSAIWGGLAISRRPGDAINYAAIERQEAREKQIEALKLLKLEPQHFAHAASNPWRSFEPGEALS